ncbi:protein of unknown function [Streptomyces murinus]
MRGGAGAVRLKGQPTGRRPPMSLRDFLERFRPTGTPGASAAGVPADRTAERAAELEPALARLTDAQQEAERIRAAARRTAEALRRDAAREAEQIVAAARERAPAVRAGRPNRSAGGPAGGGRAAGRRGARRLGDPRAGRGAHAFLVDLAVADALRPAGGSREPRERGAGSPPRCGPGPLSAGVRGPQRPGRSRAAPPWTTPCGSWPRRRTRAPRGPRWICPGRSGRWPPVLWQLRVLAAGCRRAVPGCWCRWPPGSRSPTWSPG